MSSTPNHDEPWEAPDRAKPYKASKVQRGGNSQVNLGYFDTAEEAALCYARTPDARAAEADAKWEAKLCSVSAARAGGECSMFVYLLFV